MLVSVLVATYKPRWLEQALDSALAQTYAEFEVLVLDDEPSQETAMLVTRRDDPRLRYLPTRRNVGPGATHQRGLDNSRGELIAILNHDDLWDETMLEELVAALTTHPDAVVAFGDIDVLYPTGKVNEDLTARIDAKYGIPALKAGPLGSFLNLSLKQKAVPIAQAAVFKANRVRGIPAAVGGKYDYWLSYELARTGGNAVHVSGRLGHWRESPSNLTAQRTIRKQWEDMYIATRFVVDPALSSMRGWTVRRWLLSLEGLVRVIARKAVPARRA